MFILRKKSVRYGILFILLLIWSMTVVNLSNSSFELMVYFLMSFIIYIGFSSLNKANKAIKLESKNFEKRREQEKQEIQKWLEIKSYLSDERLKEILDADAKEYEENEYHSVRFRTILKHVRHRGSKLPSLSDLRVLTYTAEEAKPSIWMMQTAISVLLISGILGTLAGVDNAINNENFSIERLQPALFPSSIAVFFSIVLIVRRGIYKRRVDEYVGRLDRHTLSFYFPTFQPPGKISEQFRETTQALAMLGNNIKALSNCISSFGDFPEKLKNVTQLVGANGEGILKWCNTISTNRQVVNFYSDLYISIENEHRNWGDLCLQISDNVNSVISNMGASSSLLLTDDVVQMVKSIEPFSHQVDNIVSCVKRLPSDSMQEKILQHQSSVGIICEKVKGVKKMGSVFSDSLSDCVFQAKISSKISEEISELYTTSKMETGDNAMLYHWYCQYVRNSCNDIHTKMNGINSMDSDLSAKRKAVFVLKDMNTRFEKEPLFYWYEILFTICILGLLVWNIILTF